MRRSLRWESEGRWARIWSLRALQVVVWGLKMGMVRSGSEVVKRMVIVKAGDSGAAGGGLEEVLWVGRSDMVVMMESGGWWGWW